MSNLFLYSNNAGTVLGAPINNSTTTITLAAGTGSLFPAPSTGQQFVLSLTDAATKTAREICYCTARSGDVCTVLRGQEGTSAISWLAGDIAANLCTKGTMDGILAAVTAGLVPIGMQRAVSGAIPETLNSFYDLQEFRFQADAGGIGNGATDNATLVQNHAAAALICGWVMAAGGGKIIIESGDYKFGKQDFAGATGLGYAYKMRSMFIIHGCTKPVIIEIQGAKLSLVNGIKYGSFDPVTGAVYNPSSFPFINHDYIADAGYILQIYDCPGGAFLEGAIEINGNVGNVVLGGYWGQNGDREIVGYGVELFNNDINDISACRIYSHHCCIDNMSLGTTHTIYDNPNILIGYRGEYAARQGLSLVGGRSNIFIACKFNFTGRVLFATSPSAGLDVESEQPGGEDPIKGIRFTKLIACEFVSNVGNGFVSDSGNTFDISFELCKFIGDTSYAIWPNKPGIKFWHCLIFGGVVNTYAGTYFNNCTWTDSISEWSTVPTYGIDTYNSIWEDCTFYLTRLDNLKFHNATLRRCTFNISTPSLANQSFVLQLDGCTIEDIEINDLMSSPPVDGVYVVTTNIVAEGNNIINSPGNKIKWNSWSAGAGGHTGYYGVTNPERLSPYCETTAIQIQANGITHDIFNGLQYTWYLYDGPPTSGFRPDGTNQIGDRFVNVNSTVGQPKSWNCTAAGNPGTIVSEGNL